MMPALPVVDHHAHLREDRASLEAATQFARLGGTHLFLATQNYLNRGPDSIEDYRAQFETTLSIARTVERETGVRVFPVLAPYPVDMLGQAERHSLAAAVEIQVGALELAGRYVRERKAVALGEVGRAHFPVSPEATAAQAEVLAAAIRVARESGCPLVLHTEDLDEHGYEELSALAAKGSLPLNHVVKHYARTYLPAVQRHGVIPSFLAKRETVVAALSDPSTWFLETDYLADPERPGAVLALDTVPRRVEWLRRTQPELVERLRIPFVEAPRKVYGLELTVPKRP
jgi:TatD-related deoxyribonuclease